MKEQVAEEHAEIKEAEEEMPRRLVETRKLRPATETEPSPRAREQPSKPQVQPTKRIAFNAPIKSSKQLGISQPQPPRLKAKLRSFVNPKLFYVEARPTTILTPAISMAPKAKALEDVRVPTITPIIIQRLVAPPLRLRLKRPSDISVRPIVRSEPIKGLETLTPIIKPIHVAIQRPNLVPSPERRSSTICMPRIRIIPVAKEAPKPEAEVGAEGIAEPEPFGAKIEGAFELFLSERSGKGVGGAFGYSGESIYIVLEKPILDEHKCLDTLHYLCVRALREYVGGRTETRAFSSEYGTSEVERHLGERDITIVDEKLLLQKLGISYKKVGEELFVQVDEEGAIADRLKNFSKGLSYVILYVEPKKAELLYKKLWSFRSAFHDKIFWIAPKPELAMDTVRKLAKTMWGFVDIPTSGSWDGLFGAGKNEYYGTLERTSRLISCKLEKPYPIVRRTTHRPESESREHLLLKEFLAKCLVDRPPEELALSKIKREERFDHLEFEKEWWKENNLVAVSDAYVKSDGIAIEVETLFEEGKYGGAPIAKIRDETVEKYREHDIKISELWIFMENLTMLKHLRELWGLRDLYERWCKEGKIGFKVKFFTLDLKREKLVRMEELANYTHEILKAGSA